MARLTVLPFLTPAPGSVEHSIHLVSPPTDLDRLPEAWDPLMDIELGAEATLNRDFLPDTGLTTDDHLELVLTVECGPTRRRWIAHCPFSWESDSAKAATALTVPGREVGGSLSISTSVVGDALTGDLDPGRSRHRSARIWASAPRRVPLDLDEAFPTSAVSFSSRHWATIPWTVRSSASAEPTRHLTGALRLYLNTDLPEGRALADGTAGIEMRSAVEADVLEELFDLVSRLDGDEVLESLADAGTPLSVAAVANYNAVHRLGLDLVEAIAWARQEPRRLREQIREKVRFMRGART